MQTYRLRKNKTLLFFNNKKIYRPKVCNKHPFYNFNNITVCIRVCVYAFVYMHNAQMCIVEVNALSLKDSFTTLRATAGIGGMNQV